MWFGEAGAKEGDDLEDDRMSDRDGRDGCEGSARKDVGSIIKLIVHTSEKTKTRR